MAGRYLAIAAALHTSFCTAVPLIPVSLNKAVELMVLQSFSMGGVGKALGGLIERGGSLKEKDDVIVVGRQEYEVDIVAREVTVAVLVVA